MIGWRRARRRGSGQPGGEAEAPPALEASGPSEPTVLAETIGHEPSEPSEPAEPSEPSEPPASGPGHDASLEADASQEAAADDLSAAEHAEHAEPATEHVTPRGAAALAEMLLTTDEEKTDAVPAGRPPSTASTSPATRLTEDATPPEAEVLAGSGTGAPDPLPTVVELDLEPAEHVHWAVAAVVVLVAGAAVATLLLLAGHVI